MPPTDTIAYKILTAEQFAALCEDRFPGAPVDIADGYIHLSTTAQLDETLRKHFAGQAGLVIAAIDLTALGGALRWEVSRGGQLFPHVYGALRWSHVRAHMPLAWENGRARLPV
ncbi:DUF952 domain-containing protein [Acidocella sp. KAb 2-4]|uniref:DUF952 domain-containing protein n=1 Tax=Acidocella sp. KAb 2-4 TaxID=2885158 RepID=UPI001D06F711|nr:DUF952 domain-containing protein [Acidocella sp. KAb 2-4]MCB5945096.1 DUF952 domain-containing protein [Acidocella sp. KAb 2-4]